MNFKIFALLLTMCGLSLAKPGETYTTKYDNINLDEILSNKRLLSGYYKCLMDQGPCTPDGQELKRNLPDAVTNDCIRCSEKQKNGSEQVLRHLIDSEPDMYDELEKKFDPTGNYKKKYMENKTSQANQNSS